MFPPCGLHQQVQVFEIVVILGEQQKVISDRVHEVTRIGRAAETAMGGSTFPSGYGARTANVGVAQTRIGGDCNLMADSFQQTHQRRFGAVVVQIEIHGLGLESRGL
jgi:hypothetical protein